MNDAGAARNTLLQVMANMSGVVFTGVLTLFLVRALGTSGYGQYTLAVSIAALLVLPTGLGLPMAVGRYLADNRSDPHQLRAILALGLRLQVPAGLIAAFGLFLAAGPVARGYGDPQLFWPLRWVALSVMGQSLFGFLSAAALALRQSAMTLRMAVVESATETSASIVLVIVGGGAAGAALGKSIGYAVATGAGLLLMVRLLGRIGGREHVGARVGAKQVLKYAGATFVVDLGWTVIDRVDILLIGGLLGAAAAGSFNAVVRIITVLGYLGTAVRGGVAPRLALGDGSPDTRAFQQGLRYLLIVQGVFLAPMIVWAKPLVDLLLGPGYERSTSVMQVLSVYAFVAAPAALLSASVTYLGAAQRRVKVIFLTLVLGVVSTYALIEVAGLVGAAIADDIVAVVYVAASLWLCTQLITVDTRSLVVSAGRSLLSAAAMAVALMIVGTDSLSPIQWLVGATAGGTAYLGALFISGEMSVLELRAVSAKFLRAVRPARA